MSSTAFEALLAVISAAVGGAGVWTVLAARETSKSAERMKSLELEADAKEIAHSDAREERRDVIKLLEDLLQESRLAAEALRTEHKEAEGHRSKCEAKLTEARREISDLEGKLKSAQVEIDELRSGIAELLEWKRTVEFREHNVVPFSHLHKSDR